MKKYYTVFVNKKLWTSIVDDMNSTESWSEGGIIFLKKKNAEDFIKNYQSEGSELIIREFNL